MNPRNEGSTLTALEALIAEAFNAVPRPRDDALVSGDVTYDPEYRDVARDFSGQTWQALTRDFVRAHADALPLLTASAFRYFLPAYLLACLRAGAELDTVPFNVVSSLAPPEDAEPAALAFWADRARLFSAAEARAICAYLEEARSREADAATLRALACWRSYPA